MANKNHYSPMTITGPNPDTIQCKDCIYRDRTIVKDFPFGITKGNCDMFPGDKVSNMKPIGVLQGWEECPSYEKE